MTNINDSTELEKWKPIFVNRIIPQEFIAHIDKLISEAYTKGREEAYSEMLSEATSLEKSIGLWDLDKLALENIVYSGQATAEQKAERDKVVEWRRAIMLIRGFIKKLAKSTTDSKEREDE